MECIGFKRLAVVLVGDTPEGARTPPINNHRKQHHRESCDGRLDFNVAEEKTQSRLVNDPGTGEKQQAGLNES